MYALSFDMNIPDLKENYGEIYNNAYYEVRKLLIRDVSIQPLFRWCRN